MAEPALKDRATAAQKTAVQAERRQFVTMTVAGQAFGLPILDVHDIVVPEKITRVPLAQPEVAGLINLRGKIVTAIDMREVLRVPPAPGGQRRVGVTVSHRGETYTLLVDAVGEVIELGADRFEANPPTLDARWRQLADGVFRLDHGLLVVLRVDRIMQIER
ncbi:chemotaxis protein CheW [Zavarzinia compransoris]|uniref:Chemotaxis protein CheW n=1 Tax=Zavarzinia compransoris TaxID=1264899 RepID=A0A317E810_9PROT|nr:chemotaxis protein CheW [Zavarzinia compransoris]PWR23278.1 chemotaxis protein CheW [Zavarzinia compransoris]TDP46155.1 purine-binding chemotaxis protein CheW [Zavarzinia compransoris]